MLGKRGREKNFTPGISNGNSGHNSGMEVLPLKKRTIWNKIGDFLEGKGFYIVLFLCVAAIGGSGYYLYRMVSLTDELPTQSVSAQAEVPADRAKQDDVAITTDPEDGEAQNKAGDSTGSKTPSNTAEQTSKTEESPTSKAEGDQDLEAEPSQKATATKKQQPETAANQSKDGPAVTTSAAAKWSWPLEGEVAAAFSTEKLTYNEAMGDWRAHTGIDIAAKVGDPVTAAMDGHGDLGPGRCAAGENRHRPDLGRPAHCLRKSGGQALRHLRRQGEGGSDHRQGGRDRRRGAA